VSIEIPMRRNPMFIPARSVAAVLIAACAAFLAACGGGPSSPDEGGITLRGSLEGASAASSFSAGRSAAETITVTLQGNTAVTTTVGADGSFTLRGLPEGSFTLLFTSNERGSLGSLTFGAVKPNQEITVVVRISGTTVAVVEERRNGIGHGDLEIEGNVESIVVVNPAGDSRFMIDGRLVVARPGQTAIREGNTARTVSDVTVGHQVHVKGSWLSPEGSTQPVLALEIKLQDDGDDEDDDQRTCSINGGRVGERVELEGNVAGGSSASFQLRVQGNRASTMVQVNAGGASFECHPASGPNAPTPAQCQAQVTSGAKVHVSGRLTSCDLSAAEVAATKVKVQK
jgi:hypothetical protein